MANRFPLVLDSDGVSKIKELPIGDNLNLRESSIVNVQNISALGTINAAQITINGNALAAQTFTDISDVPSSYAGFEGYFVKVNETGNGLEFRPNFDIGSLEVAQLTTTDDILPSVDLGSNIGSEELRFNRVSAFEFNGNLVGNNGSVAFDAEIGMIPYGAIFGVPTALSEFQDDIGFLREDELQGAIEGIFSGGNTFDADITGSVFGDDSTVLVDGVNSVLRGNVELNDFGYITSSGTLLISADASINLSSVTMSGAIEPQVALEHSVGSLDRPFLAGYFDTTTSTALVSDTLNLSVLSQEPAMPVSGMIAVADGIQWDPVLSGQETLVVYLNGAWTQIA